MTPDNPFDSGRPRPIATVLDSLRARVDAKRFDAAVIWLEAVAADLGYGDVRPLPGAVAWIRELRGAGKQVALAASGDRLFEQNLRKPLGNTQVNQGLGRTLDEEQAHFWYFNNGITGLCASLRKLPRGATTRSSGDFELSGVSIVNGAQTVAAIAKSGESGRCRPASRRESLGPVHLLGGMPS